MSDDIKSALDIVKEKIEKIGAATEEERLSWKYIPEGEKLAARYMREDVNLTAELSKFEEKVRKYILEGAGDILARNISLPRNDAAKKNNKRAMDGLKSLKTDKTRVENVYSKIRHIFNHYQEQGEQQRKQAYQALKAEVEAKMQEAVQKQLGISTRVRIDVEKQPQFQEEWRKMQAQMDAQYLALLDEYKQELSGIN
jgi:hypothetical protein